MPHTTMVVDRKRGGMPHIPSPISYSLSHPCHQRLKDEKVLCVHVGILLASNMGGQAALA